MTAAALESASAASQLLDRDIFDRAAPIPDVGILLIEMPRRELISLVDDALW